MSHGATLVVGHYGLDLTAVFFQAAGPVRGLVHDGSVKSCGT